MGDALRSNENFSAVGDDWIALTDEALNAEAAIAFVTRPDAGGIDVFIGTSREENHPQHGALVALDYAAYPEMAIKEMTNLAAAAREKFAIKRTAILHRTGWVAIAQASVIVAVSAAHRGEAFAACRFIIDTLKQRVPIWKQEIYQRGEVWQQPAS